MNLEQVFGEVAKLSVEEQRYFVEYCVQFLKYSELSHKIYPGKDNEKDRIRMLSNVPVMMENIVDGAISINDSESYKNRGTK